MGPVTVPLPIQTPLHSVPLPVTANGGLTRSGKSSRGQSFPVHGMPLQSYRPVPHFRESHAFF